MLARAPMIPMPANITKMPVMRPMSRHGVVVAVADGGDGHEAPPDGVATGLDVAVGDPALELEDEDAPDREHDPGQQDRDERRVLAAVLEHVHDQILAGLAAQQAGDPGQAAEAGQAEQGAELDDSRRSGSIRAGPASRAG